MILLDDLCLVLEGAEPPTGFSPGHGSRGGPHSCLLPALFCQNENYYLCWIIKSYGNIYIRFVNGYVCIFERRVIRFIVNVYGFNLQPTHVFFFIKYTIMKA